MRSSRSKSIDPVRRLRAKHAASSTVRVGLIVAIPEVLASLGANPAEVLGELGLDLKLFDNPENRISYLARGRLLTHCAQRTACAHFGCSLVSGLT